MSSKPDTVSCPCGATVEVDFKGEASVDAVCPDCGQMLEVVLSMDPKTKARRIGMFVKAASMAPRHSNKGAGSKEDIHTVKCTCGAQLTIVYKSSDTIYTCSACEAEYTASLKQGRTGAVSALVLRPVLAMPMAGKPEAKAAAPAAAAPKPASKPASGVMPASKPAPKAAPPAARPASGVMPPAKAAPKPAAKAAPTPAPAAVAPAAASAAKENLLMMVKGDIGAQEILTEETGSKIACFCGADLLLKGEYHREIHKCRECGSSFRIFAATNPKGGASMAIMIPR